MPFLGGIHPLVVNVKPLGVDPPEIFPRLHKKLNPTRADLPPYAPSFNNLLLSTHWKHKTC